MDDLRLIYVTCADAAQARTMGRALVELRLAACTNVLPGMQSCYRWQGQVEEANEAVLLIKTRAELIGTVTEKVKALHSYSLPCVIVLPILGGDPAYLAWLRRETD
jgi:periplasmic divalent cation tolerance protein